MTTLIRFMYVASLFFGVLPATSSSQTVSSLPRRGSLAPALDVRTVGHAREKRLSLSKLRGKVVVLEFWATWCAPCLDEIPKINSLAQTLSPEKVQFVSVTDEEPAVVKRFLQRHPMSGSIVIDTLGSVFERYGVVSRPATVVIDPAGRIASNDIAPDQLSRFQLLALFDGKTVPSKSGVDNSFRLSVSKKAIPSQSRTADDQDIPSSQPLTLIKISKGRPGAPHLSVYGKNYFDLTSATLVELVQYGIGYSANRINLNFEKLAKEHFDLSVQAPLSVDVNLKFAVAATIESALGVKLEHEMRNENVLILETSKAPHSVHTGGGIAGFDPKKHLLVMMNASGNQIASASEDAIGKPVLSELGAEANCTGSIQVMSPDEAELRSALEEKCGIETKIASRPVDRITITAAKE